MDDGITSLEVYNTVYNITEKNNKLEILLKFEQLDALELDTGVVPNIKKLYDTSDSKFIGKTNKLITNSFSKTKKLTRKDFDQLKENLKFLTILNNKYIFLTLKLNMIPLEYS